jgi:hypothetical protein
MTPTVKFLMITALALSSMAVMEQSQPVIIGSWKVISVKASYPPTISPADKMKSEMGLTKEEQAFKASPFVFHENGDLEVMKMNDHWMLSKDGKSFKIVIMKDESMDADIISLTSTGLVFTVIDHDIKETFTLQKNN